MLTLQFCFTRIVAVITVSILLSGCLATKGLVRQSDLDSWVGVPVKALDTHSIFLTMRLERSFTDDGMEIRNYINEANRSACMMIGYNLVCNEIKGACNNIFYIEGGYVIEYRPTGSGKAKCFTDATLRPQGEW